MATDDGGRREPKDIVADLVAERAQSFGVDVGAAAGLADVLSAEIDGWFKQSAGAAARTAYHAGRRDQRDGKPCPYCECARPDPAPRPVIVHGTTGMATARGIERWRTARNGSG